MQRPLSRSYLPVSLVTVGLVLSVAAHAGAQNRVRGETTDQWDNPLEGVTVLAERSEGITQPQTVATDDRGRFLFTSLSPGQWSFTATLAGYQGLRRTANIGGFGGRPAAVFGSGPSSRPRTAPSGSDSRMTAPLSSRTPMERVKGPTASSS